MPANPTPLELLPKHQYAEAQNRTTVRLKQTCPRRRGPASCNLRENILHSDFRKVAASSNQPVLASPPVRGPTNVDKEIFSGRRLSSAANATVE
jgi:hypothetical protein